jgi:hypothetical protein
MVDIFDSGTPKYSSANDIYEKLCEIANNEESVILGEMFPDVSYDNQDYYYADKGGQLQEKFEKLSAYGENMWLMDLADSKLRVSEEDYPCLDDLHDIVFQALNNDNMAKRIGFKPLFIQYLLNGETKLYKKFAEEYEEELRELSRFGYYDNMRVWQKVINKNNFRTYFNGYQDFSSKLHSKILNLQLADEMSCIAECRAFCNSHDDFILGLQINQGLYNGLERQYNSKVAELKSSYDEAVRRLLMMAQSQGVNLELPVYEPALLLGDFYDESGVLQALQPNNKINTEFKIVEEETNAGN